MTARTVLLARTLAIALVVPSAAMQAQAVGVKPSFNFSPAMLDSKDGKGTTLALEYAFKLQYPLTTFGSDENSNSLDPNTTVRQLALSLDSRGVVTPEAARNPRNFLEFNGTFGALVSTATAGTFSVSAKAGYEADQSFVSKQAVYGGTATYGKLTLLGANDFVGVTTSYVQVDPAADTVRASLLGTAGTSAVELEPYGRWSIEGLYMAPITLGPLRALELNVRYYTEPSAPAAIKRADLDRHLLGTIRLGLVNDLFVAYSVGSLPFDRKDDRVYALGWSYKLQ